MRSRPLGLLSTLALFAGLLSASPARGTIVTLSFEGTVFEVNGDWAAYGSVGDTVSGSFSYDLATPDENPSPNLGIYDLAPPARIEATLGLLSVSSANNSTLTDFVRIDFVETFEGGLHRFEYSTDTRAPDFDPMSDTQFDFFLLDNPIFGPADALMSDALPTTLDVAKFDQGGGGYAIRQGVGGIRYSITRIVPEPGAELLLALGSAAFARGALRRRAAHGKRALFSQAPCRASPR